MRFALVLLLSCCAARADTQSVLKTTLAGLDSQEPIRAQLEFSIQRQAGDESNPAAGTGKAVALIEDGPQGLKIFWRRDLIQTAAEEIRAHSRNPEKKTPAREAMDRVNAITVCDYLNAGPELLRKLESAQLVEESSNSWQGRPARLLAFKLAPQLSQRDRKYIKDLDATAKVWLGADGVPLAAESSVHVKGRAMLVITFESDETEHFVFAHAGNRLVVTRHMKENRSSGGGEHGIEKTIANLSLTDS